MTEKKKRTPIEPPKSQQGGSGGLIIGISVVIVLIVGLLYVVKIAPSMTDAMVEGNEVSALGSLGAMSTAQTLFRESGRSKEGENWYATLAELGDASLLDTILSGGRKQGYQFACQPSTKKKNRAYMWAGTANPIVPGESGKRYFFVNNSGKILVSLKGPIEFDKKTCKAAESPDVKRLGAR